MTQKLTSESIFSVAIVSMVAMMFIYEAVINLG